MDCGFLEFKSKIKITAPAAIFQAGTKEALVIEGRMRSRIWCDDGVTEKLQYSRSLLYPWTQWREDGVT